MILNMIGKYQDFFEKTKNEPVLILQGSKRSGKTFATLQNKGTDFLSGSGKKYQFFSASPKQQNFGLMSDFQNIFNPILRNTKNNATQKTYRYRGGELAFINIANNTNANDIANSLGACDDRYVNECNMFSNDMIEKLMINNRGQMVFDYNPYRKFWIDDLITDANFLKTTWKDNPCLTDAQIQLFQKWTNEGQSSEIGSYPYWRWQVMCEGNYAEITGEIFTTENIKFCDKPGEGLHHFMIFADPSNAKGGDYFALTLTAIGSDGNMYLLDSFSCNRIEKVLIAEQIKKWKMDYPVEKIFIETNGEFGKKFFTDCRLSGIDVLPWHSSSNKYERIMANFDVITGKTFIVDNENNREFARQIYTFKLDCDNDDNIDCLNNAILAYIFIHKELKVLF